jgi:hypothetical protein
MNCELWNGVIRRAAIDFAAGAKYIFREQVGGAPTAAGPR